jgi:hypothetical protein
MTVGTLASIKTLSAPVVGILLFVVIVLLSWRASSAALGFTLTRRALRYLDLSIALSLVVFGICVIARFKVIG